MNCCFWLKSPQRHQDPVTTIALNGHSKSNPFVSVSARTVSFTFSNNIEDFFPTFRLHSASKTSQTKRAIVESIWPLDNPIPQQCVDCSRRCGAVNYVHRRISSASSATSASSKRSSVENRNCQRNETFRNVLKDLPN